MCFGSKPGSAVARLQLYSGHTTRVEGFSRIITRIRVSNLSSTNLIVGERPGKVPPPKLKSTNSYKPPSHVMLFTVLRSSELTTHSSPSEIIHTKLIDYIYPVQTAICMSSVHIFNTHNIRFNYVDTGLYCKYKHIFCTHAHIFI